MMDDRKLVPFDRGRRMADPARVREFAATARKLQRERETSAELVERALRETPMSDWPRLAEDEAMRNSGVLDRLSKEVDYRLHTAPLESLAIANLATAIAETLPADRYPAVIVAQIRAQAWKDRGHTLDYLARYDEAFDALDRAESQIEPFGTLTHDLAIVRLIRATALQHVQRFEDSLTLLAECRSVFHDHGDTRRQLLCGINEGAMLHRLHRYRDARDVATGLLEVARELRDRSAEACIHNLLGQSSVEMEDFGTAEIHLARAHAIFLEESETISALRVESAIGLLCMQRGDVASAVSRLHATRQRFLSVGLVEEAGICGLEIVGSLLDMRAAEAEALARQIVDEFNDARLSARAITALGYLTEAIAARHASRNTVVQVRDYIRSLHEDPTREFSMTA